VVVLSSFRPTGFSSFKESNCDYNPLAPPDALALDLFAHVPVPEPSGDPKIRVTRDGRVALKDLYSLLDRLRLEKNQALAAVHKVALAIQVRGVWTCTG
jgi:hypothetical protein